MKLLDSAPHRASLAAEFDRHEQDRYPKGDRLSESLCHGLTMLRNTFYCRIHEDVESQFGLDSMLMPLSPGRVEERTKLEIEIFQIAESTDFAVSHGLVADQEWYRTWLAELRLGGLNESPKAGLKLQKYLGLDADGRRIAFARSIHKTSPESARAPLVLFRLMPLAVGIVSAVAFGRHREARERRREQIAWLPSIEDCGACSGRLLDNGDKCGVCGNPLWNYHWLTATD